MPAHDEPVLSLIERAKLRCEGALGEPDLVAAADALARVGVDEEQGLMIVRSVADAPESHFRVLALKKTLATSSQALAEPFVERLLLLRAACRALEQLPGMPVTPSVKRLFCEEVEALATPDASTRAMMRAGQYSFGAFCKLVTLRRFPAGQIQWEELGVPRAWLLRAGARRLLPLAAFVAFRMRGFAPVFFAHLAWRRKNRFALLESEHLRAYHRIAGTLELQPEIRGFMAESWFHSPDTFKVSPHLAWLNRTIEDNGGLVTVLGPADPESGVLVGDRARRRAYEAGEFKPTTAVALWPRDAMIAWARRHPEWAED